ncbi:MAG: ABC transporter ATP-binding protein [Candidatus Omnitrophica bacterium]|nr:ABC transporter ATP-binding protein [Candidatus Omnitrophota bacterium]
MESTPVQIEGLIHRYSPERPPAVDGIGFSVKTGEVVGLLGPNGAGKTTTLHAILGLLDPTAGLIRVFGRSPIHERGKVLPLLSFASADVDLPSNLVVEECLRVFAGLYGIARPKDKIWEMLERLSLSSLSRRRIGTLSAGEQMRLKLCKALLHDPRILVLDEPTRSLDPCMASAVREMLQKLRRERRMTILLTSHNMQEVESFCDRILFLHRGKLLIEGATAEVLSCLKSRSLDELFIRIAAGGELFHAG